MPKSEKKPRGFLGRTNKRQALGPRRSPVDAPLRRGADTKQININIAFPSFGGLKRIKLLWKKVRGLRLPKIRLRRRHFILAFVVALAAFGTFLYRTGAFPIGSKGGASGAQSAPDDERSAEPVKPPYKTTQSSSPSAAPIKYDPERKVASFTDQIGSVPITVSQQALPDPFKADPMGELARLAERISANDPIQAGDLKAYVGTSARGPQTLVMVKGDLLILISSSSKIPNSEWATYIGSLQ